MATDVIKIRDERYSFATHTTSKRGRWLSDDYFDVEPTDDSFSHTGIDAFMELMRLIKSESDIGVSTREVIKDAAFKMDDVKVNGKTRRWVAYEFMNLVSEAMTFFAMNTNWEPWLQERIEEAVKSKERYEQRERERMAELTRRSIEARQKRKQAMAQDALCASVTV